MKKIILGLLVLLPFMVGAQSPGNDTTKYIYYQFTYGNALDRYYAKKVLLIPNDTAYSKDGIARKGGTFYIGNGTKWSQVSGGGVGQIFAKSPLLVLGTDTVVADTTAGNQKIATQGLVSRGLAGKVANSGASSGITTGTYASRPSASNCQCYYGATDSAKWYYDNGSWITMGGGSGGSSDSAIWKNNGSYSASRTLTMNGFTQSFSGGHVLSDTNFINAATLANPGAFVHVTGHSKAYGYPVDTNYNYAHQVAGAIRLPLINNAVVGQVLVRDSTLILSQLRPYVPGSVQIIDLEINDIILGYNRGVFLAQYAHIIDTLENHLGWPGSNILNVGEDAYGGAVVNQDTLVAWNTAVKAIVTSAGCPYDDVYGEILSYPWGSSGIYTVDNEHGNLNWHSVVARGLLYFLGYHVYQNHQNLGVNGHVDMQKIRFVNPDSADAFTMPAGLKRDGSIARYSMNQIPIFNPPGPQIGYTNLSGNNHFPQHLFGEGALQDDGSGDVFFFKNLKYVAGTGFVYLNNDYGSAFRFSAGNAIIQLAPNGTAGATASVINPQQWFQSGNINFNGIGVDDGTAMFQINNINPAEHMFEMQNSSGIATLHVNTNGQINFQSSSIGFGIGIGASTVPTAVLHLGRGNGFPSQAPLKFSLQHSLLMATPEPGAMETDSLGDLTFTDSTGTRDTLAGRSWARAHVAGATYSFAPVVISGDTVGFCLTKNGTPVPGDSVTFPAISGGLGNPNSNIGSGFRFAVPNTNNIKTLFCSGCTLDSTTNTNAMTLTVSGGTAANPTASVGLSAVNGSASTYMRSDAAPALSQSITPTWTGAHTFSSTLTASSTVNLTGLANASGCGGCNMLVGDSITGKVWHMPITGVDTTGYSGGANTLAYNAGSNFSLAHGAYRVFTQTALGSAVTNTTTNTSILGTGVGSLSIAGSGLFVGEEIILHGTANVSTTSSAQTLTIGALIAGSGLAAPISLPASMSSSALEIEEHFIILATGASGSVEIWMRILPDNNQIQSAYPRIYNSSVFTGITLTGSVSFDCKAQWTTASTGNSIQSVPSFTLKTE